MAFGYSSGIVPSNMIATLFMADAQSLIGMFHFPLMFLNARRRCSVSSLLTAPDSTTETRT